MNIGVFCGSSKGNNTAYAEAAETLGSLMAKNGHTLVYGGGNIGLMGILADSVLNHGGSVIGVIPGFLMQREVGHTGLAQLEVVDSMHQRKKRMADLSQAFITLPGGWGTLDETAEILTWKQLGLIKHPLGFINTLGFFDLLLAQMQTMSEQGFLQKHWMDEVKVADKPAVLLEQLTQRGL
ncbi:MAG: TIGR00730 family Rossman fold protein [Flammeovirgaceae bacterium]|nr:TIGR00730 family Rossman fold protein [Flammeovirgaceae bacterium]